MPRKNHVAKGSHKYLPAPEIRHDNIWTRVSNDPIWMTKKLNNAAFCLIWVLFSAFYTGSLHAETRVLKLAHVDVTEGAIGRGAIRFATHLEQLSSGSLTVDVIPRGALGGIRETWAQMQVGSVDMQVIDLSAISLLKDAESLQVTIVPFLFRDQSHFRQFAESELLDSMLDEIRASIQIRYLGIVEDRSPRVLSTTKKKISTLSDVKGMRFRTPPHPMFMDVFKAWGAIPTPIAPADMFMALKSGMVEGEDNGVVNLVWGPNSKVIKHVTPINWSRSGVAAWISELTWHSLDEQQREWVLQAARISSVESKPDYEARLVEAQSMLPRLGITVEMFDVAPFENAVSEFADRYEGKLWPAGLVADIRALK